jgi:hypothetical protein
VVLMSNDDFDDLNVRKELRAARSTPTEEFVSRLVHRIGAEEPRRLPRRRVRSYRPAFALAATLSAFVVAGAFGGISEAAATVAGAVSSIVHVGQVSKPQPASTPQRAVQPQAAQPQAASSSHAVHGGAVHGGAVGSGGVVTGPPHLAPPTDPVSAQYISGCNPGFHGPYIKCVAPGVPGTPPIDLP